MSESVVYEPRPRYVVQVASRIEYAGITEQGAWTGVRFFHRLDDATAHADQCAEDKPFVRVIDRGANG